MSTNGAAAAGEATGTLNFERTTRRQIPRAAYVLFAIAILAVSSAASAFRELEEQGVPPLTVAAWRLQATSLLLLPLFAYQWRHAPPETRLKTRQLWWLLAASGACLALHFDTWVWGLGHTSIPHALLFVTSSPLLITIGTLVMRAPIGRGEIVAAFAGFCGMVLLCIDSENNQQVTVVGDVLCLFGALAIIGYLQAGAAVRKWMPIFLYAAPVTTVAALLTTLVALAADRPSVFAAGKSGIFGYFASRFGLLVLYLALVPGVAGHTGFNTLLRFFSPLVISMAFPLEPLVGSILACTLGLSPIPGILTWLGGAVMVAALVYNTYAAGARAGKRERRAAVSEATAAALADSEGSVELAAFTIADEAEGGDDFVLEPA